jgi:hypothetical protein
LSFTIEGANKTGNMPGSKHGKYMPGFAAAPDNALEMVNIFQGTDPRGGFSHGNK